MAGQVLAARTILDLPEAAVLVVHQHVVGHDLVLRAGGDLAGLGVACVVELADLAIGTNEANGRVTAQRTEGVFNRSAQVLQLLSEHSGFGFAVHVAGKCDNDTRQGRGDQLVVSNGNGLHDVLDSIGNLLR
ncbi:hypothetical protein D3C87_1620520 [compost metagenome]